MSNDPENYKAQFSSEIKPTNYAESKEDSKIKWLDNQNNEVEEVFGFNENAELVNSRAAMIGFLMLILTELAFGGAPVTLSIFGIN